jgi:hypothetical protein
VNAVTCNWRSARMSTHLKRLLVSFSFIPQNRPHYYLQLLSVTVFNKMNILGIPQITPCACRVIFCGQTDFATMDAINVRQALPGMKNNQGSIRRQDISVEILTHICCQKPATLPSNHIHMWAQISPSSKRALE